MTETGVKKTIARLITDEQFKNEFLANPQKATEKSGYALDTNEISALSKIKAEDIGMQYSKTGGATAANVEIGVTAIKSFKNAHAMKDKVIRK